MSNSTMVVSIRLSKICAKIDSGHWCPQIPVPTISVWVLLEEFVEPWSKQIKIKLRASNVLGFLFILVAEVVAAAMAYGSKIKLYVASIDSAKWKKRRVKKKKKRQHSLDLERISWKDKIAIIVDGYSTYPIPNMLGLTRHI